MDNKEGWKLNRIMSGFYPEFMRGGQKLLLLHVYTIFLLKRGR